jgi:acetoacetyl-CoA synthetase
MEQKILWKPSEEQIKNSNMFRFKNYVNEKHNLNLRSYEELHQWSVTYYEKFWKVLLDFSGIKYSGKSKTLQLKNKDDEPAHLYNYIYFKDLKINFAENLTRFKDSDKVALEYYDENKPTQSITYRELYNQVSKLSNALSEAGVKKGSRVAGFIHNGFEAVIAMLATTAIGAVWSSVSPDFGAKGVIDRFKQIKPDVLFAVNGYSYNGKLYDKSDVVAEIISNLPELKKLIWIDKTGNKINGTYYDEFINIEAGDIEFEMVEFNHPLYIMYSSGTTGLPKSIVHGAGGTLLQHYKELVLHTNLNQNDKIMYFTTTGWMMWNWLVSSLFTGCTVGLIDGSPGYPDLNRIWKLIEKEKITVFGTSPKFLKACEENKIEPKDYDMSSLKTILSTGAPLSGENYKWVYGNVKKDIMLSSISGGTDIISCFMLGTPLKPVIKGEIQARGLGMKVEAFDNNGNSLIDKKGELVCTAPFPSMPVYFWNDEDNKKLKSTYFEDFNGVWKHGDYIKITNEGGIIVYGRSDATLNPGGVRIGTAEIYRVTDSITEVQDSLIIGQNFNNDIRLILFVILNSGITLNDELKIKIKNAIKSELTPRHTPHLIFNVSDIPHTLNGKKVEIAVTNIFNGEEVLNTASLANPKSLYEYMDIAKSL